jgi:hypothetical protein
MRAIAVVTMTFLPATFVSVSGLVRNNTQGATKSSMQDALWDELFLFRSQWRKWEFVVHRVRTLLGLLGPVSTYDCCDARCVVLVESMGETVVCATVKAQRGVVMTWE